MNFNNEWINIIFHHPLLLTNIRRDFYNERILLVALDGVENSIKCSQLSVSNRYVKFLEVLLGHLADKNFYNNNLLRRRVREVLNSVFSKDGVDVYFNKLLDRTAIIENNTENKQERERVFSDCLSNLKYLLEQKDGFWVFFRNCLCDNSTALFSSFDKSYFNEDFFQSFNGELTGLVFLEKCYKFFGYSKDDYSLLKSMLDGYLWSDNAASIKDFDGKIDIVYLIGLLDQSEQVKYKGCLLVNPVVKWMEEINLSYFGSIFSDKKNNYSKVFLDRLSKEQLRQVISEDVENRNYFKTFLLKSDYSIEDVAFCLDVKVDDDLVRDLVLCINNNFISYNILNASVASYLLNGLYKQKDKKNILLVLRVSKESVFSEDLECFKDSDLMVFIINMINDNNAGGFNYFFDKRVTILENLHKSLRDDFNFIEKVLFSSTMNKSNNLMPMKCDYFDDNVFLSKSIINRISKGGMWQCLRLSYNIFERLLLSDVLSKEDAYRSMLNGQYNCYSAKVIEKLFKIGFFKTYSSSEFQLRINTLSSDVFLNKDLVLKLIENSELLYIKSIDDLNNLLGVVDKSIWSNRDFAKFVVKILLGSNNGFFKKPNVNLYRTNRVLDKIETWGKFGIFQELRGDFCFNVNLFNIEKNHNLSCLSLFCDENEFRDSIVYMFGDWGERFACPYFLNVFRFLNYFGCANEFGLAVYGKEVADEFIDVNISEDGDNCIRQEFIKADICKYNKCLYFMLKSDLLDRVDNKGFILNDGDIQEIYSSFSRNLIIPYKTLNVNEISLLAKNSFDLIFSLDIKDIEENLASIVDGGFLKKIVSVKNYNLVYTMDKCLLLMEYYFKNVFDKDADNSQLLFDCNDVFLIRLVENAINCNMFFQLKDYGFNIINADFILRDDESLKFYSEFFNKNYQHLVENVKNSDVEDYYKRVLNVLMDNVSFFKDRIANNFVGFNEFDLLNYFQTVNYESSLRILNESYDVFIKRESLGLDKNLCGYNLLIEHDEAKKQSCDLAVLCDNINIKDVKSVKSRL